VDRYRIPAPNGRAVEIGADQLRRIARGLGDHLDALSDDGQVPPIVRALCSLPISQRADALAVALHRFGDKQDVETISQACGLSPWQVWQYEEAFRRAVVEAQVPALGARSEPIDKLESALR